MRNLLAQVNLGNIDGVGPLGTFGHSGLFMTGTGGGPGDMLEKFVSSILGLLTIVASLWFIYQIVLSGMQWIGAGGDKNTVEVSKKRLSTSILGMFIVVGSYGLIGIIGRFLGLDIFRLGLQLIVASP